MAGKLWLQIAAGCLALAMIGGVSALIGSADDLSDYEQKQKDLDKQAQEYQSVIDQTASDIAQKEEYKQALINKISILNEQIVSGRDQISTLDFEIENLQSEIDSSRNRISGKIDMLKQRIKVIYLSGETTSLEIILGAKSFEDFLDKLELVSYMSNSDKKMIDQLQNDIDTINKKKEKLNANKDKLAAEQEKLNSRQTEMQKLIDENEKLLDGLYASNAGAQDHLDEANAERQAIEDMIMAYFADQEAQERNARLASEAEALLSEGRTASEESSSSESASEESSRTSSASDSSSRNTSSETTTSVHVPNDNTSSTTTSREESSQSPVSSEEESRIVSSEPEPESEPEYIPDYSSGYVWPVPGHYSLSSVWNENRDTYNHGAIDISDGSIMNAQVVAAQSGTVILSNTACTHNYGKDGSCGCGGGYGNYLMIDHGNGKATLYAHLTSLTVSSGDYVRQGQVIGYVGTTGWSTGPHLHFETRLNGVKYNPMSEYPNM